jgi:hypothetical protein
MKDEVKAKLVAASDGWLSFLTHDLPGSFALSGSPSISQIPNVLDSRQIYAPLIHFSDGPRLHSC